MQKLRDVRGRGCRQRALFLQFDLPPTHEAAMFLKTWLTLWMQAADGWKMTSTSLQLALYSAKQKMEQSYSVFMDKGVAALGDEFQRLFKENMERKKDGDKGQTPTTSNSGVSSTPFKLV